MNPLKYTDLETSKKLFEVAKEHGFTLPESEKTHQIQFSLRHYWTIGEKGMGLKDKNIRATTEVFEYPAYDLHELGEALRLFKNEKWMLACGFEDKNMFCELTHGSGVLREVLQFFSSWETEIKCRAKMLTYLIENKLITN